MSKDVEGMGTVFEETAINIIALIANIRTQSSILGGNPSDTNFRDSRKQVTITISKHLSAKVHQLAPGAGITRKQLEKALIAKGMRGVPCWVVFITMSIQYLRKNVTSSNRKLLLNGYRDLVHFRCPPYVDYFVTDKYFTHMAKRLTNRFPTIVYKNVQELVEALGQTTKSGPKLIDPTLDI